MCISNFKTKFQLELFKKLDKFFETRKNCDEIFLYVYLNIIGDEHNFFPIENNAQYV